MIAKVLVFLGVETLTTAAAAAKLSVDVGTVRHRVRTRAYLAFKRRNGRWAICDPTSLVTRIVMAFPAMLRPATVLGVVLWLLAGIGERIDGALSLVERVINWLGVRRGGRRERCVTGR